MVSILSSAFSVLFKVGGYYIIIIEAFQYHNIHSKSLLNFSVPNHTVSDTVTASMQLKEAQGKGPKIFCD